MISNGTILPIEPMVKMSGDIDITCGPELSKLEKRLVKTDSVVIDVTNVHFVDTTFLRFLIRLRRHPNKAEHSAIKLVGVGPYMRRIFEVTGLMRSFDVECGTLA